jgi:hypothetical protein
MKLLKSVFIVAIFSMGLFASCTPESIADDQTEQQIDLKKLNLQPPVNG